MRRQGSPPSPETESANKRMCCTAAKPVQGSNHDAFQDSHCNLVAHCSAPSYTQSHEHLADQLLQIEINLSTMLCTMSYPSPVSFIYNPIDYAFDPHRTFVKKYCKTPKTVLFLGMNPGPFGMVQTGVPFGEIKMVQEWLKVEGLVRKPSYEHPQRPVLGFQCRRSEVSGQRFWEFFKELCGNPDMFFYNCYVHNYCPVAYMNTSGKNITPPELPLAARKVTISMCDKALVEVIKLLQVKVIVGIGRFAHDRAAAVLKAANMTDVQTGFLMHPSPINPAANKGWKSIAFQQLQSIGIMHLLGTQTQRPAF